MLTPFHLTPLSLFHTLVSLVAGAFALLAIVLEKGVSPKTRIGRIYLWSLLITTITGLPIFRHGSIGPPHVLGVITLVALAVAAVAEWTQVFGRASAYVRTISCSATVLLLMIPAVTETLTRVPPGAPLVASPEAPIIKLLQAVLLGLFLVGVTLQLRRLRAAPVRCWCRNHG